MFRRQSSKRRSLKTSDGKSSRVVPRKPNYQELLQGRIEDHWASIVFNLLINDDGYVYGFLYGGVLIEIHLDDGCERLTIQTDVYTHNEKTLETMKDKKIRCLEHPDNESLAGKLQQGGFELQECDEKIYLMKQGLDVSCLNDHKSDAFDKLLDDCLGMSQEVKRVLEQDPFQKIEKTFKRLSFRRSIGPGIDAEERPRRSQSLRDSIPKLKRFSFCTKQN